MTGSWPPVCCKVNVFDEGKHIHRVALYPSSFGLWCPVLTAGTKHEWHPCGSGWQKCRTSGRGGMGSARCLRRFHTGTVLWCVPGQQAVLFFVSLSPGPLCWVFCFLLHQKFPVPLTFYWCEFATRMFFRFLGVVLLVCASSACSERSRLIKWRLSLLLTLVILNKMEDSK